MSHPLLETLTLAALVILGGGWFLALLYPLLRPAFNRCSAPVQARLLALFPLLPSIVAILMSVALLRPGLAGLLIPDHCHSGVCGKHPPVFSLHSPGGVALVAMIAVVTIGGFWSLYRRLYRANRQLCTLNSLSDLSANAPFQLLESSRPIAWCAGLFRPRIFVSRGLLDLASEAELHVIISHEQAHLRRRDNMRMLMLECSTGWWPSKVRSDIKRDFHLATERTCDQLATYYSRNYQVIATALEKVKGLDTITPAQNTDSIGSNPLQRRLDALATREENRTLTASSYLIISPVAGILYLILPAIVHFAIEWVARTGNMS